MYKKTVVDDIVSLEPIRIMFSGNNLGNTSTSLKCVGRTGLSNSSTDNIECNGCNEGDDNYLSSVNAKAGDQYILFINSFSRSSSFDFSFAGDAILDDSRCDTESTELVNSFINIYPNPTESYINLDYNMKNAGESKLFITDMAGKVVYQKEMKLKSTNGLLHVETSDLAAGQYNIRLVVEDEMLNKQFIKI